MIRFACVLLLTTLGVAACDSDDGTPAAGGTPTPTPPPANGQCAPALGASSGCPQSAAAETAFSKVESTCGITQNDLDGSNPDSPTLTATAQPKLCSTCDCRTAVYAYETLYAQCTNGDPGNAKLAKNLYDIAAACK